MTTRPGRWGLYEPQTERDACGIGFVAHIPGEKSRSIVEQGLEILARLSHRAACGCDPETGDGAGIMLQVPHRFFEQECAKLGIELPRAQSYGVGMVFLPADTSQRLACEALLEEAIAEEGQRLLGWRDVPVVPERLGFIARDVLPVMRQVFVGARGCVPTDFPRRLYVIRKLAENWVRERGVDPEGRFHVASLSSETIVYKGLLLPDRLAGFYPDLGDPAFESALALVHSRFSTNTFPTWDLAQPFRYICHNGEINTVQGNRNWTSARRSLMKRSGFGGDLERLFPIIVPGKSDSAQFDNMLELLYLAGRGLPHAMMMMIPEAWENHVHMEAERQAFYRYTASLMEPWDGPAAIAFTDGHLIGATLDRNGLRPARYLVTEDDRVILASETGVLDVHPSMIRLKGRLQPGRMLLVDTDAGRILDDDEVKYEITRRWPYGRWLKKNVFHLDELPEAEPGERLPGEVLTTLQRAFGYTDEDARLVLAPMAESGEEPVGSMGTDTPLAVLSDQSPSLFNYFKQLFAQVTNPPIDPIREALVMSVETFIGAAGNMFEETPEQCHRFELAGPVLTNGALRKILAVREGVFRTTILPMLFDGREGAQGLERALRGLCDAAVRALQDGYNILVLSDRGVDERQVPIPALLAVSAVHQRLVRQGIRLQTGLVVETGEAREVHHFALLVGYGAAAVNPYLVLESLATMSEQGLIGVTAKDAEKHFIKAINKGLMKVMSKMGISTLQSYRGAQIFEAIGLNRALVERYFTGTASRVEGVGLAELGREALERHERGYGPWRALDGDELPIGGYYQWRRRGEKHRWNPATIATLQAAVKDGDLERFEEFCRHADDESCELSTLRGLLDFDVEGVTPVPLDEVESVLEIAQRFCTGAMSFGSISAEAHETLALAMNRLGGKSNTGEGGEEPQRFAPLPNGDSKRSAIKQVASGRFGVTAEYLINADELQIKIAQGAKPGEGGQLPGHKVDERIAKVRCSTPGVSLISPPPHHDIYSIEDLAQLIYDLKCANPAARISVKLVAEVGVGTIAAGVAKARAGGVVIAGDSGGTGASPLSSVKHAGLPWELGLAETQQVLVQNDLRDRIRVQVDGGLRTPRDVVVGALLGADEFGFSTAPLIALGCIMLRKCHLNTCSVGIATQSAELRKRFAGTPEAVVVYFTFVAEGVRRLMAQLGFRRFEEMIGRVERLRQRRDVTHWKAQRLDLSAVLAQPQTAVTGRRSLSCSRPLALDVSDHMDVKLIEKSKNLIRGGYAGEIELPISNTDRAVGAMLSGAIAKQYGNRGLVDDTVRVRFTGSAGQSFGAFLAKGLTFSLEGDANDYIGKGLSGGRIIVFPPRAVRFAPEENILIGNTVLYGATSGELYARGMAGERFAVRNSGARAVVEGVGDHGCEYMTGGVVIVLGPTGRNFAAGMSGGTAFVFDRDRSFPSRCNTAMVDLEPLVEDSDIWLVRRLVEDHMRYTQSALAKRILDNWEIVLPRFVKVMPREYRRVLDARRAASTTAELPAVQPGLRAAV
jgi:glutamate synthase (NADPH) large chain